MVNKEKVLAGLKSCADSTGALCRTCPYDFVHNENCMGDMARDALELLKEQQETIASLQVTIYKLNAALAKQPEQKFFIDSDGKMTPLPIQKHGHWIPVKLPTGVEAFGYKEYTAQEVTCSECKFTEDVMASAYLYCPNCGARMDEEVKQDADD